MNKSIWTDGNKLPEFNKLSGDVKTDVLIIGGGICGILCAYFLEKAGVRYVLAEGGRIACGITKNTTAKITSQHGLIYDKIIKSAGREKAQMYLNANQKAVDMYSDLCKNIECGFETKAAYTYSLDDRGKIEREIDALAQLGFDAGFAEDLPLPFRTAGAVKFENQAQFDPLKFISEISKGLNIYENTFIRDISEHTAVSDGGKIYADKIIVATHFPFINKHGSYFLKMYQHRSYTIALKGVPDIDGMYVDEAPKGMSFRNYKDMLIIGGGDHRTGKSGGNWQELRAFAAEHYPRFEEKYMWSAQDCMTLDLVPYIGHYSKRTPNLYVASGFNKWGITSSMAAAMILSDMVCGRKNECSEVFSPHRSMLKPQLFVNGFEAVMNLLTPSLKRCPHLGCALKWNSAEHTWECPCHGSRFEENGELIDNPATGKAKV